MGDGLSRGPGRGECRFDSLQERGLTFAPTVQLILPFPEKPQGKQVPLSPFETPSASLASRGRYPHT